MRRSILLSLAASGVLCAITASSAFAQSPGTRTGKQVYETTCITCHGPNGRGGVNPAIDKIAKPADFGDCQFANREPDRAFLAVARNGGPSRGFHPLMAPWAGVYTDAELARAIEYIRSFCDDQRWPRGELNLPRPFVTAKAFPEDEIVVTASAASSSTVTRFIYERRFGPLNQVEIIIPFAASHDAPNSAAGLGDIALEYKRTLAHSLERGNIVSVTAEVVLPTGDDGKGLGSGVTVFEPFVTFGQLLPRDAFVQVQAGMGVPLKRGHDKELFWRAAIGKSFEPSAFGRVWAPMVEILASRPLVDGARIDWDVLPGVQVTLNKRQHVRLAGGIRVPVTNADVRGKSFVAYLLWDWFEGGFFDGW